ncbi:MAG: hypothetical protein LBU83_09960 [Bacteroidales bacterium]|jgi:hypothetical protein|nr:hypothetical protein [Bacteroidales bacterium]
MNFKRLEEIKKEGFTGFKTMKELFKDNSVIPQMRGVYMVLNMSKEKEFLTVGRGGFFKGKNPNISIQELENNWVENAIVVYIGKAGGERSGATLQSRLEQYFRFGQGKNVGHYGGRLIWQLKNSADLVVCWKELPTEEPRMVEIELIRKFIAQFSKRPFANLTD